MLQIMIGICFLGAFCFGVIVLIGASYGFYDICCKCKRKIKQALKGGEK